MKYLIMVYSNPESRAVWEGLSNDQRLVGLSGHRALAADLAASGELLASEALADPAEGTRVSVRDGRTLSTDGPFAEVKEHLAGFYLVDCVSLERAIEYAARIPEAAHGFAEVRPIRDLSAFET